MQHLDLIILSGKNVYRAGNRTLLCILAISIGIASVSAALSLGTAAGDTVQNELDKIGIDGVVFYPKTGSVTDDVVATVRQMNVVSSAMPLAILSGTVTLRNLRSNAGYLGIDEALEQVFHLEVLHGTLPSAHQIRSGAKIAVIDEEFAQKAYRRTNIVGKEITVSVNGISDKLTVCAVIRSQSASLSVLFGGQLPHLIYLPHTTLSQFTGTVTTDKLVVSMRSDDENSILNIQKALNRQFMGNYQYENLNQYLESFHAITAAISLMISGIAAISVIVGGIGVMNSMVSSVETRTREIGIYRALGAKKRTIIFNFMLEAILLCFAGGICGITFSKLSMFMIYKLLKVQIAFQWKVAIVSLVLSVVCGILFGMMPAIRAARLDPIKAIRSE